MDSVERLSEVMNDSMYLNGDKDFMSLTRSERKKIVGYYVLTLDALEAQDFITETILLEHTPEIMAKYLAHQGELDTTKYALYFMTSAANYLFRYFESDVAELYDRVLSERLSQC